MAHGGCTGRYNSSLSHPFSLGLIMRRTLQALLPLLWLSSAGATTSLDGNKNLRRRHGHSAEEGEGAGIYADNEGDEVDEAALASSAASPGEEYESAPTVPTISSQRALWHGCQDASKWIDPWSHRWRTCDILGRRCYVYEAEFCPATCGVCRPGVGPSSEIVGPPADQEESSSSSVPSSPSPDDGGEQQQPQPQPQQELQQQQQQQQPLPPLKYNGKKCTIDNTCEQCEGDCRRDSDCGTGLVCFVRDSKTVGATQAVPGCSTNPVRFFAKDFCVSSELYQCGDDESTDCAWVAKDTDRRCVTHGYLCRETCGYCRPY